MKKFLFHIIGMASLTAVLFLAVLTFASLLQKGYFLGKEENRLIVVLEFFLVIFAIVYSFLLIFENMKKSKVKGYFLLTILILALASQLMITPTVQAQSTSVLTIRPNSAGTYTQWYPYPSGPNWDTVNETTQNGDTDYVFANASSLIDTYYFENTSQQGNITKVRIGTYAKQTTGNEKLRHLLIFSGVKYYGVTDHVPTTDYALYTNEWATNPSIGVNWTWSDINSIEGGIESLAVGTWNGTMSVTQVYIEVEYRLLDVTFSASPTAPNIGDTVTISWVIKRTADNSTVTDFLINITKDGSLWKTNLNAR